MKIHLISTIRRTCYKWINETPQDYWGTGFDGGYLYNIYRSELRLINPNIELTYSCFSNKWVKLCDKMGNVLYYFQF